MSYIPYSKNPSGIAFFGTASSDPLLRSDSRLAFNSSTGQLLVSGTPVSVSGHTHLSSDITNFANSVSGLLPNNLVYTDGNQYISGNKNFVDTVYFGSGSNAAAISIYGSTQASPPVNIVNDNGYFRLDTFDEEALVIDNNILITSATIYSNGLSVSGSATVNNIPISVSGHKHLSSDITSFASSVSGLLPVKNILSGSGINVSNNSGEFTVAVTGSFGLTGEQVDDRVNDLLRGQNNIILNYDDNNNTLTISTSGLQASGNYANAIHSHVSSDITNFNTSVSGLIDGIYAKLNSPSLTGVPLAPTAASGTNTNQIASTSFVRTEISNLVASAPSTLDTLNELATALGNDPNFATTITNNLASKAALSGATFTGTISSPSGNFTSLTVSEKPVINGGYDYEIHVSQIDGDDTTGNGDLLNPVASITKALTLVGSQRKTIIVHPGTYTESPSITVQYTTITGPGLIGGNILLSGTLSTNTGCTIAGIKMTNLTITTPNGTGNVNILNCEISGTLTKSSNADYTVLRLCDYGAASITGAGLVAIFGGNPNFTTVNNAGANVIIKSAITVAPVLTSGTLSLVDSVVVAAVTNAITSAASSVITLANCQMLTSTLSNVAPIVLNGFYSIISCVYNKPSSTLATLSATGGSTNSIDYFQYIHADKFITQGGTSSQYVKGDGSLALFPDNIVYTSGNQTISGVKTFSDLPLVNGTGVSISGHSHTSSNITDFNSSVSGLLPVKNITAGYDISIVNTSGSYSIASTNLVHVDSKQPQGFINRTDSRISVSGNIFTIAPTGSSYSFYNQGIKVIKTSGDSLTIPNITQINYIHFDTINNQLSNKTTGFDFSTDIPIAYVAWNSGVGPSGQMTFFAEERHGIVMDTSTHKWIHNTFGAQYVDGLSIGNYVLGGNGTSNSHATISIGNGTLYQEDIEINITDSSSTDPFCQELSPIAQIPVYYHEGSTGQWVKNTATDYPVKYGANGPQYNLFSGGTWTIPDVSPGGQTRYFAVWILATNQIDDPIISIMGQRIDSNQGSAENNNLWSDVNLTNLPLSEVKPLYRLIFAGDRDYTNAPKCSLYSILDIRVAVISTIAGVSQNDHGSLFGLGDDDHSQYLHIDNNRTVNATHNFVNGIFISGVPIGEVIDDEVAGLLIAGSGITLNYNDNANTLTINSVIEIIHPFLLGGM